MPRMSLETQESRVIPWGTKITATEREIVARVAEHDKTTPAELIRELALSVIRQRYERIQRESASDLEPAA